MASGTNTATDGSFCVLFRVVDRPELLESLCAINRWFVVVHSGKNVVVSTITVHRPLLHGSRGEIVGTIGLNNIVLNERVQCPAINRKVTIPVRLISTAVLDHSGNCRVSHLYGT